MNVVLWRPAAAGPGSQRYTSITLLYPGAHPAYVGSRRPVTTSMTLSGERDRRRVMLDTS